MRLMNSVNIGFLAVMIAGSALAQNEAPPVQNGGAQQNDGAAVRPDSGGWRRIGAGPQSEAYPEPDSPYAQPDQGPAFGPPPAQLTIPAGTFVMIRSNQVLSSDRSHQGDIFSGTLVNPVVVDGRIVADRGQSVVGMVSEAKKAGFFHGSSRLGLQLTDLTLVDGHQLALQTNLSNRTGPGNGAHNAAVVGGTTAVGAGVGAVAAGGEGAAIGAGAGLAAGTLGALLTPGYPTIVDPEQVLTFRIDAPIVVSTASAPMAFRPVTPQDYQMVPPPPRLQRRPAPRPYAYGPYYPYGYPYPYFGPSIGIGVYRRIR